MSKPSGGYRAWQEGGPNETRHGGPWFVTVPDGGDIEIGYDANGKPDEYHAQLFASAEALVKALEVTRQMIRGQMIEAAVIDIETMQPLGDYIDAALSQAAGGVGQPPRHGETTHPHHSTQEK